LVVVVVLVLEMHHISMVEAVEVLVVFSSIQIILSPTEVIVRF